MSDPEDLQSDIKSGLDEWIYQLKRIGPPATCPKVPDVMRLNLGLTKIGRGQQNDFYLDSAVLKNFISRSHVEIFGKKNENGEIEYILTDKGLNGTFINDIRTHKTCVMEVGDKVTFGHTNGYKIQPGSYAEQPSSEFQFVFERVPKVNKTTEIIDNSHTPMEITDEVIRNDTPDLKNESTIVSDRLFLSDLKSNVQSKEKSSSKTRTSLKSRTRKDSSENSDLELSPLSTSKSSSHTKSSSVANTKKRNSDTSVKSLPVVEPASSRRKSSIASSGDRFSETLKAQNDDDEDDDDNDDNDDDENENDKKDDDNDSSSSSSSEEEEEIVKPKIDNRKKRGRKPNVQKKTPVKRKITAPSDSEDSSEEDEASKPEADQKPKSQSSVRQKQAATAAATKKKKTGNDAPAIGSRKRRRKGAGATATSSTSGGGSGQNRPTTSDDLEPGVEWYEDDRCEAPDCKRPKKKRTPWVQCDDCDAWYHTVCVGANYNKIKDSDEHFNCGCE